MSYSSSHRYFSPAPLILLLETEKGELTTKSAEGGLGRSRRGRGEEKSEISQIFVSFGYDTVEWRRKGVAVGGSGEGLSTFTYKGRSDKYGPLSFPAQNLCIANEPQ